MLNKKEKHIIFMTTFFSVFCMLVALSFTSIGIAHAAATGASNINATASLNGSGWVLGYNWKVPSGSSDSGDYCEFTSGVAVLGLRTVQSEVETTRNTGRMFVNIDLYANASSTTVISGYSDDQVINSANKQISETRTVSTSRKKIIQHAGVSVDTNTIPSNASSADYYATLTVT
jgi:hypothetical protein